MQYFLSIMISYSLDMNSHTIKILTKDNKAGQI